MEGMSVAELWNFTVPLPPVDKKLLYARILGVFGAVGHTVEKLWQTKIQHRVG